MGEFTLLNEIKKCRSKNIDILRNSNRFRVMCKDGENQISAYYFSCPVYRGTDNRMITLDFVQNENKYTFIGSNAIVVVGGKISISNAVGQVTLEGLNIAGIKKLMCKDIFGDIRNSLYCENADEEIVLFPTCNGIALQITAKSEEILKRIKLTTDKKYTIWGNGRYSALMIEERQPFITVNSMCALNHFNSTIFPIFCYLNECSGGYDLDVKLNKTDSLQDKISYIFTIDLYAAKSIFDTTVESANPDMNNSYGSTAFIGNSSFFNEQWLFARIDPLQLLDLKYFSLKSALLYAKKYTDGQINLDILRMNTPWCSFGNTWNTKTESGTLINKVRLNKNYLCADITEVVRAMFLHNGEPDAGIVIKPERVEEGAAVIATADNYFTPQILEIKLFTN